MEPGAPQWPSQPWGRPKAPEKDPDRGLWSGHHRPVPYSHHNGERFYEWQDVRRSPQPQQGPRADYQQPRYASRPGDRPQPGSGVDYYAGGYPAHLYSRVGYKDPYQRYYSPALRDEFAYASYCYSGRLQRQPEERELGQLLAESPQPCWLAQHLSKLCCHFAAALPAGILIKTALLLALDMSSLGNSFQRTCQQESQRISHGLASPAFSSSMNLVSAPAAVSSVSTWQMALRSVTLGLQQLGVQFRLSWTSQSSLLQQHESGLSSSSCELSQYMADGSEECDPRTSAAWSPVQAGVTSAVGPKTPKKFYVPHVSVSFGPGGQLVCVCPSSPMDGQAALVELRSMESMVGSDIAELLMQDCKKLEKYKRQPPVANLISLADEDWPVMNTGARNLLTGEIPPAVEMLEQTVEKFTKLLYYGRKKASLPFSWACFRRVTTSYSTTHASSRYMDSTLILEYMVNPERFREENSFTSTLALNDPLQTLFQLMSGRIPQAATCCGDNQWGDWRPHLAVILSNQSGDPELHQRAIVTMGDTLAGKGFVEAAHFCYLMAHVPFGHYTVKTDLLVLLGSSHSQEFLKFAATEPIQRTEIFEYCQMLGRPRSFIPSFQVYKLLYASRLADYGLASQALHYCEAVGTAVLSQGESSHPVLLVELIKLAERLKLSDPLVLERRCGDRDLEPDWLGQVRRLRQELEQKVSGDIGDPHSARPDISGAKGTTDTFYQDLSGRQASGSHSALWPTPEQTGPTQPGPLTLQLGPYPVDRGTGHTGVPVPLYSVPETCPPATGDGHSSVAVMEAPGGRAWKETLQMSGPEENTMSQEASQHYDGQNVIPKPQVPLAPRARTFSENSGVSVQEDEEESTDEADKKPSSSASQREKSGDLKDSTKSSGFGWFSWFRSKPSNSLSEEDSLSDCTDSESVSSVSSELYSKPGVLPPPPSLEGAVPLYNPSQVPRLPATSLSRPSRLAQHRYPTQPC
ncbi:Protein transport protein Sec16B [Fukomys damarensis]|uniref:Protein transport protein Sec16B n=1 Tax=Fukomys damarensis TaxID=885580 RepID=A0A091DJK0_FUKDA|nr:Protein transport protein Sec16B [Fukomys damarensis]